MSFFPIAWTSQGIVHSSSRQQRVLEGDPLLTTDVSAIVLRWADPWVLRLVEPWPQAVLRWSGGDVALRPKDLPFHASPEQFADRLEALVQHLEARAPSKVGARAWLDVPEQPWERVRGMPELPSDTSIGEGAFRSAPRPVEERVVAVREKLTPMEAMWGWLMSRPGRPWRDHPREVRLTETYLYAERRDRSVWRLPLGTLRHRTGTSDAAYVFGRRTSLILLHRATCPVRERLDMLLERGPSTT